MKKIEKNENEEKKTGKKKRNSDFWLVQFPVIWLVGAIKHFNPPRLNKFIYGSFRSRMRAPHPSRGSPTGHGDEHSFKE
jgi:hypothetical protein